MPEESHMNFYKHNEVFQDTKERFPLHNKRDFLYTNTDGRHKYINLLDK